jgi:hypothetical protein
MGRWDDRLIDRAFVISIVKYIFKKSVTISLIFTFETMWNFQKKSLMLEKTTMEELESLWKKWVAIRLFGLIGSKRLQ